MKTNRKTVVASAISLILCVAMLIGTTYACFTDSVVVKSNRIQSGTLDVALSMLDGSSYSEVTDSDKIFNYKLWEPGYSDYAIFKIENNGTLALEYKLEIIKKLTSEKYSKLENVIDVYFKTSTDAITSEPTSLEDAISQGYNKVGTLGDMIAEDDGAAHGYLLAKSSVYAGIVLHMQETAGNEYQNLSVGSTFDVRLLARQYTYEKDGFGSDQYDKNADYALTASDRYTVQDILSSGGTVSLSADLTNTGQTSTAYVVVFTGSATSTLDLNGHSIIAIDHATGGAVNVSSTKATLNIIGDGILDGGTGADPGVSKCALYVRGTANIYGGTFATGIDSAGDGCAVINSEGGTVNIYGGFFYCSYTAEEDNQGNQMVLNTFNDNPGTITCYGGTFVNQDPSKGDDVLGGTFVAEGYHVESEEQENGDIWYTVVKD